MYKYKTKHVYFIYDPHNNLIKIGISTNPIKRFKYFVTQLNEYELLYIFWGAGKRKEKELHIKFRKYLHDPGMSKEWFVYSKEIQSFVSILRNNNLVWIAHIPIKKTKNIGFKTDIKTYNKIKKLGVKKGYSVNEMVEYIIRRIAIAI